MIQKSYKALVDALAIGAGLTLVWLMLSVIAIRCAAPC